MNFLEDLEKLSFDESGFKAVLSNPPYNTTPNASGGSSALYHYHMNVAKKISEKFVSMIYPFKWVLEGRGEGLQEFREEELVSKNYSKFLGITDEWVFELARVRAGVNIFLWDREKTDAMVDYSIDGSAYTPRKTLLDDNPVMIRFERDKQIVDKVATVKSFDKRVAPSSFYNTNDYFLNQETIEKLPEASENEEATIVYYVKQKGGKLLTRRVSKKFLRNDDDDWKLFTNRTTNGRVILAGPGKSCSHTFIKIGSLETEQEAINLVRYFKTDFFQRLLKVLTITQHASRETYQLIPDVDFVSGEILDKPGVFLDFDSPETLDSQLADVYGFTVDDLKNFNDGLRVFKDKLDVYADRGR